MQSTVLIVFALVYLGMILGGLPGLALDRTGVALLGAIALVSFGALTPGQAWQSVDVPTIGLLFGMMVISSQFRLGGFYARIAARIASSSATPERILAFLIAIVGGLSAILGNDILCLAMTPILLDGCARRGLNPLPFLLALACSSNIGSAATLIGNPQNILVGEALNLSFSRYLLDGGIPALLGLAASWAILCRQFAGKWHGTTPIPGISAPTFDIWQTGKAAAVTFALMGFFLWSHWPRDVITLAAAGTLLLSRRTASRAMLGQVDWHLLVLFVGLFVVNHTLQASGMLQHAASGLQSAGVDLARPSILFSVTVVLSNLVSNVPACMLLIPSAKHELAGPILALASTLAGNLFVVGSIANIIVIEQARALGYRISWAQHARTGVPVTLATLTLAAGWLWLRA